MFDNPSKFSGHDERAPPSLPSEGPGCQVRWATMDDPLRFIGHDGHPPDFGWVAHITSQWSAGGLSGQERTFLLCFAFDRIDFRESSIWGAGYLGEMCFRLVTETGQKGEL